MTQELRQVVVLSKMKFSAEFWKKILEANNIQTLTVEEYQDFSHFLIDLKPDILLVDLKLQKEESFSQFFEQEIKKTEKNFKILFLGTQSEWQEASLLASYGSHLLTPVNIRTAVAQIEAAFKESKDHQ